MVDRHVYAQIDGDRSNFVTGEPACCEVETETTEHRYSQTFMQGASIKLADGVPSSAHRPMGWHAVPRGFRTTKCMVSQTRVRQRSRQVPQGTICVPQYISRRDVLTP